MIDPEKDLKNKIQSAALAGWVIGCFVIFLVSSVAYYYFGLKGEVWFQIHGIMVALIIANYTSNIFKFMSEAEDDIQE